MQNLKSYAILNHATNSYITCIENSDTPAIFEAPNLEAMQENVKEISERLKVDTSNFEVIEVLVKKDFIEIAETGEIIYEFEEE